MKTFARRVLRPLIAVAKLLARPITSRVHVRVVFWARQATEDRFANLEYQTGYLQDKVAGLERYVPAILNAIASQNATNRANVRSEAEIARLVRSVLEHFDAVVAQLHEARDSADLGALVEPKVLHPERLSSDGGPLRLNLASGHIVVPGFVNVDVQPFDEVDVLADPRNLPFDPASVAELRADHLLERYSAHELEHVVLPHWVGVLAPGATLVATVRDADAMVRSYVSGQLDFETLRQATFGTGEPTSRPLRTMVSRESAVTLFERAGLEDVSVRTPHRPSSTFEFEIRGRRPAPAAS